ncbi:transcription termination factor NusA [Microaceticoccus formicicus]|uniref:transcription termination factor NusA n=1 Tax=Microaceticoccus formicicus TaxID=3118105 RepID=UPI003CD03C47|nr:transcription termination factor NusA [Peptoniphilaceae bacterium AMB_02]
MNKDFILALEEIEKEKGISRESIFEALEKALIKSYEKNFDNNANVSVEIDRDNGKIKVFSVKTVVEEVVDPITEIELSEAKQTNMAYEVGDTISLEVTPMNFGRIAAQTARNIVIQKIKDMERDIIYSEFVDRERELVNGSIQRIDSGYLFIDLGKLEGVVPPNEQVPNEVYKVNSRMKFYISEVKNTTKGAQIVLSRASSGLIMRLFELEVPEVNDGTVDIFSISREAGSRTKIAVFTKEEDVDPVGACVGFKGARVKAIVDELNGEKIDIIVWDKDPKIFIKNSLSPSEVIEVYIDNAGKSALAIVPDEQLSLAIGKEGQNVRLAAKLTGWKIDIKGKSNLEELKESGELDKFNSQEATKEEDVVQEDELSFEVTDEVDLFENEDLEQGE